MYRERIEKLAPGYDPAHVEGLLRDRFPVLDALSPDKLAAEVQTTCEFLDLPTHNPAKKLEALDYIAKLYGLRPKKRAS